MEQSLNPIAEPPSVLPPIGPNLGIVGGGQLARMTAMAALELGCNVTILERSAYSPAATLATHSLVGDWTQYDQLKRLAELSDIVTLENEFLDAELLARLERDSYRVLPGSVSLALVQDKLVQKQTLAAAGLPLPCFMPVAKTVDVLEAARTFGWPMVLKARRNAYDGKGNATLHSAADLPSAWDKLRGETNPLFVEQFCPFVSELAVIITRSPTGELATYPLVRSIQRDHICHEVHAPASVPEHVAQRALAAARQAIATVQGIGSWGVEMFLTASDEVLINELAPRVHNSGHYTIEGCICSQFENHVRAVLGWPLGSTKMVAPAAVMINLLGAANGSGRPAGLPDALAIEGAHLHLYGKTFSAPGKKLGHVTALGGTLDEALAIARRAAAAIQFGTIS